VFKYRFVRGMPGQLEQVKKLFGELTVRCKTEYTGHLPDFIGKTEGYLFDIYCGDDVYYYCTKWVPNPDVLIKIADHIKADFSCTYDEPGNCIYGEFSYNAGVLTIVELAMADFFRYEYDDEKKTYLSEGKHYDDNTDIKEILLQRKKEEI
jgi:Api92-like protein with ferredoxin domain